MTPKYKVRRARIEYFPAYFLGSVENTVNIYILKSSLGSEGKIQHQGNARYLSKLLMSLCNVLLWGFFSLLYLVCNNRCSVTASIFCQRYLAELLFCR